MIRLRRALERGLANRWLRILLLILLVGLLAFVIFHTSTDSVAEGAAAVCLAVIMLVVVLVIPELPIRAERLVGLTHRRGPPVHSRAALVRPISSSLAIPLRR